MKILILFLVLAISTQPLQAGFCDVNMEKNQESSHHMDDAVNTGHDCCDSYDADVQKGCDGGVICGNCFASVFASLSVTSVNPTWANHYPMNLSSCVILPGHSSPPFHPPTS